MRRSVIALSLCLLPAAVQAQDLFPIVSDYEKSVGLPAAFDILGIPLLAKPQDVDGLLDQAKYTVVSYEEGRGLGDGRGNEVSFNYGRNLTLLNAKGSGFDKVQVHFSSNLTGNRVYSIHRNFVFDKEVATPDLVKAFTEKFGAPSYEGIAYGSYLMGWTYANGALAVSNIDEYQKHGSLESSEGGKTVYRCEAATLDISGTGVVGYSFIQNRENKHAGCNGGIKIEMDVGARDDLARGVRMLVWDYDLAFQDLTAQDQFMLRALEEVISGKEGGELPKL
ncbi:MAG: hypothetical protein AB7I52_16365 [Rhizobiaceae bacterium]